MIQHPTDPSKIASGHAGRGRKPADERLDLWHSVPFFLVHLAALAAIWLEFRWYYPVVGLGLFYLRMFGITAGFHRYFAHRAYKTGRAFQTVLAVLGTMAAQKGVLWWAAHHRDHHKHADQPDDLHSPRQRGLWWSHLGWILCRKYNATKLERIKDFARFPELRWLNRWHLLPPALLVVLLYGIGGLPLVIWGFVLSTVLLWHSTFAINSLAHVVGRRRYPTSDDSRNSFALAVLTMGEGWHNNHHYYMSTANQGWFWWQIDPSYYILKALSWVGIVRDLRTPPAHIRAGQRHPSDPQATELARSRPRQSSS